MQRRTVMKVGATTALGAPLANQGVAACSATATEYPYPPAPIPRSTMTITEGSSDSAELRFAQVLQPDTTTYWESSAPASQWFTVDVGAQYATNAVTVANQSVTATGRAKDVQVAVRSAFSGEPSAVVHAQLPNDSTAVRIPLPVSHGRYLTVTVSSVWAGSVANLATFDAEGTLADMVSPPAHLNLVAGATAEGAVPGWLFDGNPGTVWSSTSTSDTLIIDTQQVALHRWFRYRTADDGRPSTVTVLTSIDGQHWSDPETVTTSDSATTITHTFASPRDARFLRLDITGVYGGSAIKLTDLAAIVVPQVTARDPLLDYSKLAVIGDSLTFQYDGAWATLMGYFTRAGWRESTTRIDGLPSRAIFSSPTTPTTQTVVANWAAEGWNAGTWLLPLGTNNLRDSVEECTAEYLKLLGAIGPRRKAYFIDMGFVRTNSCAVSLDLTQPAGERYAPVGVWASPNAALLNLRDQQLAGLLDSTVYAEIVAVGDWNFSPLITPRLDSDWNPAGGSPDDDGSYVHNTGVGYEKRDQMYANVVASAK